MEIVRAYDLNPLIFMEMQHSSGKFSHANAFVSPRRNKDKKKKENNLHHESLFMNVAMRDS